MNKPKSLSRSTTRRTIVPRQGYARSRFNVALPMPAPRPFPVAGLIYKVPRIKWLAFFAIVGLVVGLTLLFNLDTFFVYDLDVSGIQSLTKKDIEHASGLRGWNIFFIEPRDVERALASLPEVKSVNVATALPNRVSIRIVERQPELVWLRGNETFWVTSEGIVTLARGQRPDLIILRDVDQRAIAPGKRAYLDAFAAQRALREAWKDAPRVLEWSNARGLSYNDEHGWKIYLGDASEMSSKLAKLRVVTTLLVTQGKRVSFIDVGKSDPFVQ